MGGGRGAAACDLGLGSLQVPTALHGPAWACRCKGCSAVWRVLYLQAMDRKGKSDAVWKAEISPALSDRKKNPAVESKVTQHQQRAHTCYINNVKTTYAQNNMKAVQGRLMSRNVISSVPKANQPSSGQARNILDYVYACGWWKVWEEHKRSKRQIQFPCKIFGIFFPSSLAVKLFGYTDLLEWRNSQYHI